MGNVKLQQGGVYVITTQGGSSTSPRSLSGTEEIFEKTITPYGNGAKIDSQKKFIGKKAIVLILKD